MIKIAKLLLLAFKRKQIRQNKKKQSKKESKALDKVKPMVYKFKMKNKFFFLHIDNWVVISFNLKQCSSIVSSPCQLLYFN